MDDQTISLPKASVKASPKTKRESRLKLALMANMARRKAQVRARAVQNSRKPEQE